VQQLGKTFNRNAPVLAARMLQCHIRLQMFRAPHAASRDDLSAKVKAVLGPTNTGKTHLAIERLCAHSSGAIGFPLRLLAREVYDRVRAIKGERNVALITGEERIEPKDARWMLCTVEAMPVVHDRFAFVALDEAQLGADRERGHVFTDRLLHARGREETMILGSGTVEPLVRALVPRAEIVSRPRFSTLSYAGARKLSRIPPRSAIVAFSAEQVYAIAEMLRRFRGGSAVVMGALSPETRNRQVELYQSGEVDYIVATDAIGMGLNLDINHVAFAGLSKFDGQRQRRLTTAEMAQIAGRAGRHQRDGSFGTLTASGGRDETFTDEEIWAIEQHRFPPLTKLFWREAEPRFDSLSALIRDLDAPPSRPELAPAPEAIDLAVLRRLSEEQEVAQTVRTPGMVERFWQVCRLPDFRQQGAEFHARFVARLWQDLRHGELGADYMAQAIAQLDNVSGDIDTLQGRIAAIRSWAYIAQRPDWVLARDEMAARARAVEARLSDALHARLTERFVNRRTTVLMKTLGTDAALLPVRVEDDGDGGDRFAGDVYVEDAHIGRLSGFRFEVDPGARAGDRKLLLAAAERHLPGVLAARARRLADEIGTGSAALDIAGGAIRWHGQPLARLKAGRPLSPALVREAVLDAVPEEAREGLVAALEAWLEQRLAVLGPLRRLDEASRAPDGGAELRALLIRLVEAGGVLAREGSGLDWLDKGQRTLLARLGVTVGALDLFVLPMLRPAAQRVWSELHGKGRATDKLSDAMAPVLAASTRHPPHGYRALGRQQLRVDIAEKLLREAHGVRGQSGKRPFVLDPARAVSTGLTTASYARLLQLGGFRPSVPRPLAEGAHGPVRPPLWRWQPPRRETAPARQVLPRTGDGAFAALAGLFA
jgi:ATP-dependent RNA helicase SUPV3L1/SUV3